MAAGRPAADIKPRRIASQFREMLVQPTQRSTRLTNNAVHSSLGRQGVARDSDIKAVGEWSLGNETEALLRVALPIAPMEEQQGRGASAIRGEEIEASTWRIAVDQIEMIRHPGAERLAAAQPVGEVPLAICHSGGVVVSGVERLPIHRAVNDHRGLRSCWTGTGTSGGSRMACQLNGVPDSLRRRGHVEMCDPVLR